jgi:surfactin synthase thioesterase subunit
MAANTMVALSSNREAPVTLVWLPHAGGSAAHFQELSSVLPDRIESVAVEYPGRGRRCREPLCSDLMRIADEVASSLFTRRNKPYVLFGHSMGASVGFEVCRLLRSAGAEFLPKLLIVSSCAPPHLPSDLPLLHRLPDAELVQAIMSMEGMAAAGGNAEELLHLRLPVMRSDLAACELHRFLPVPRLDRNIAIYCGVGDSMIPHQRLPEWGKLTSGTSIVHCFGGGHFYMMEHPSDFVARLGEDVLGVL